jgi:transcriptional regulator with GAF, ATPase, and Fis domain
MGLFSANKQDPAQAERDERLQRMDLEYQALKAQVEDLQELVRHLDEDRDLLLGALAGLRPGEDPAVLAQALLDLCFKPMDLACFYVALADWDQDELRFVLYQEGGRTRSHPARRLSEGRGLSEKVLTGRQPIYIRTLEAGRAAGSLLTAAEEATGLIPHSWYGVPLGWGPRPDGLVSFQSFHTDAFSESRRRVMDALGALISTCMSARQAP